MNFGLIHYGYGALDQADIRYEPLDIPILGPNDVMVSLIESPINPSDVNTIQGNYVFQPPLPAGLGREGVGRVVAIGHLVTRCQVGDRVISIADHHSMGFWRNNMVGPETEWWVVPDHISNSVASNLAINGLTAYLLLTDFVALSSGESVVYNAPNSAVGRWLSFFCDAMGLTAITVLRDGSIHGAHRDDVRLGFNSVGGASMATLSKVVRSGGTIVTFGAMEKTPPHISNKALIYKEQRFTGFLRSAWVSRHEVSVVVGCLEKIVAYLRLREIRLPDRDPFELSQYQQAFAAVQSGRRAVFRS